MIKHFKTGSCVVGGLRGIFICLFICVGLNRKADPIG